MCVCTCTCVHTHVCGCVCACARAWVHKGGEATKGSALRKMISDEMPNQGQFSCTYCVSETPDADRNLIKTKSRMRVMFRSVTKPLSCVMLRGAFDVVMTTQIPPRKLHACRTKSKLLRTCRRRPRLTRLTPTSVSNLISYPPQSRSLV